MIELRKQWRLLCWPVAAAGVAAAANSDKSWSLAASGDILGNVVPTDDPSTLAVWDIVRAADFGFFNLEGNIFSHANFTGYPSSENGGDNNYGGVGGGPAYDPAILWHLKDYGFNLASHANNHAWDYDLQGMLDTHGYLDESDMTFSGTGMTLQEARKPAYRQQGDVRLGLVSAAGSHAPQGVAGPGSATLRPRPGVSVLRAKSVARVNQTVFDHLKEVARMQGQTSVTLSEDATELTFYTGQHPVFWPTWRLSENPGLDWDINAADFQGILASIREAKANADVAVFSLHAHESDSGAYDSDVPMPPDARVPASYAQNISRSAIEAGADLVLIHGPHHLRGIEIYSGRPIFYSLNSLVYNLGLQFRGYNLPIEWDDGMIATTEFEDGKLSGITIHPIVHSQLQNDTTLPDKMMPKMAPEPQARRILEYLQDVSEPFGTTIEINGTIGHVKLQRSPGCVKRRST